VFVNGKTILAWVVGVLLPLLGVVFLAAPLFGIPLLLVGLYVLPPVRRRVHIDVPVGWLAGWIGGLALLLGGALAVVRVPIGGLLALVGGVVALPPLRDRLTTQLEIDPGRGVVLGVVLLATVGAGGVLTVQQDELFDRATETHAIGEGYAVAANDSELTVTITDVARTRPLRINESDPEPPQQDTYLVVTARFENTGENAVGFDRGDLAVVGTDGNTTAYANLRSDRIDGTGRYLAPGIDFPGRDAEAVIPAGETVNRTLVFDVTAGHTYLFTILPTGQAVSADRHYVPLGRVAETDEAE